MYKRQAVVGTVDLKLPNVPFISVDEFVVGDGMARLSEMIQGQAETVCETKDEAVMDEKLLTGTLEQLLYFLNPKKMAGQAMECLKESVRALHMEVTRELAVRYVIHLCCMLAVSYTHLITTYLRGILYSIEALV